MTPFSGFQNMRPIKWLPQGFPWSCRRQFTHDIFFRPPQVKTRHKFSFKLSNLIPVCSIFKSHIDLSVQMTAHVLFYIFKIKVLIFSPYVSSTYSPFTIKVLLQWSIRAGLQRFAVCSISWHFSTCAPPPPTSSHLLSLHTGHSEMSQALIHFRITVLPLRNSLEDDSTVTLLSKVFFFFPLIWHTCVAANKTKARLILKANRSVLSLRRRHAGTEITITILKSR